MRKVSSSSSVAHKFESVMIALDRVITQPRGWLKRSVSWASIGYLKHSRMSRNTTAIRRPDLAPRLVGHGNRRNAAMRVPAHCRCGARNLSVALLSRLEMPNVATVGISRPLARGIGRNRGRSHVTPTHHKKTAKPSRGRWVLAIVPHRHGGE